MTVTLTKGGGGTPSGEGLWDGSGSLNLVEGGTNTFQINDLGRGDVELAGNLPTASTTASNVGTAGTNVAAAEYGDGYHHTSVLTLTGVALLPTIPADAEGAGAQIYTFPAGDYMGLASHLDITAGVFDSATNAAIIGLGSVIATGDVSDLNGTATFEDWLTGQAIADVSSPATEKSTIMTAGAPLVFEAAGSHGLFVNIAGTWNATVASLTLTGTVTIRWDFLGA